MAKQQSALEVLGSLTLDGVRQEIAGVEAEIGELQKKIDALRVVERALDVRENGSPKRKPRQPKAEKAAITPVDPDAPRTFGRQPSPETIALRQRIVDVLKRRGTPLKIGELTRIIGEDYATIQNAVNGKEFTKTDAGYTLAN